MKNYESFRPKTLMLTAAILAFLGLSCTMTVEHEFDLNLGIDDECLFTLPDCSGTSYTCHSTSGTLHPECEVRCIAAAAMMCGAEGPECIQHVGDDVQVPVVCVTK